MENNYFEILNQIDVSEKIEKKNNLAYLSWAWAWGELKKKHPDAIYTIYENATGWNYHTDGHTCWVKTGVTVNNIEHIEYLPVMDYKNKSINADLVTSFDINKTIQRSLTKAVARHGLGLYIYAGEDLPESPEAEKAREEERKADKESREIKHQKISKANADALKMKVETLGRDLEKLIEYYKVKKVEDLTFEQWQHAMTHLDK